MAYLGKDILDIAMQHIGEAYILGARAPLSNKGHTGPWDCAEFTSWCAYQAYGIVFGTFQKDPRFADAYSGQWYEDGKAAGTLISVEQALATPGAFVVRRPGDFAVKIGHIAISAGGGKLVEARSASTGVVLSSDAKQRRWTTGLLLPGVNYAVGKDVKLKASQEILYLSSPFIRGDKVKAVQQALKQAGFFPGKIDGVFGPLTATAVANFQLARGLLSDGEIGPETANALGLSWPIQIDQILDLNVIDSERPELPSHDDEANSDELLRPLTDELVDEDIDAKALDFKVIDRAEKGWWVNADGRDAYVGHKVPYRDSYGLVQRSSMFATVPGGIYSPSKAANVIGDWAWVLWPTIQAESAGVLGRINTYDRARFTFGFFQMAAHTAEDNFILFFRHILKFETAKQYFPDLLIKNNKVHQSINGQLINLEEAIKNPKTNEMELPRLMEYFNPSRTDVEKEEVERAGRMILWNANDPKVQDAQAQFAYLTIKKKLKSAIGAGLDVDNLPVRLGIWVLDNRHQGRATVRQLIEALAKPNQEEALKAVGKSPDFQGRVDAVSIGIKKLMAQTPRFADMKMGDLVIPNFFV